MTTKVICSGGVCQLVDNPNAKSDKELPLPSDDHWTVYGGPNCPWCTKVKEILDTLCLYYDYIDVHDYSNPRETLYNRCKRKTIPSVYCNGEYIGGYKDTKKYLQM